MYWLTGRISKLSVHTKLLIYKQLLISVWIYGVQLEVYAKPINVDVIQRFQNKVLHNIVDDPWYIQNTHLHGDLKIDTVKQ